MKQINKYLSKIECKSHLVLATCYNAWTVTILKTSIDLFWCIKYQTKNRLKPSLGCIPNLSLSLVQFLTGTVCNKGNNKITELRMAYSLESPIETSNAAVFLYQLMKTVFTFFQLSCVTSDIIFNFCRVSIW